MEIRELFFNKNIKLTRQRQHIINTLKSAEAPLSLDEIERKCNKVVDFSSVFRTIKLLIEKGIVQEHYFGDKKPKYNLILDNKHDHFIKCVRCGKIEVLKDVCILNEVSKKTSFKIVDHHMEFMGLCPECSEK